MRPRYRALCLWVGLAGAIAFATPGRAGVPIRQSRYVVSIPDPPCDVEITPANAATALGRLNDSAPHVFCVDPGDYRGFYGYVIRTAGTPSSPRYLRYNGPGAVKAFQRADQAIFERIDVRASWWVIQGLTFRPQTAATERIVSLSGVDHVIVDGNLVDAIEQPNGYFQDAVVIVGNTGVASTDNTIQRNVIRNGDQSHQAYDFCGVLIAPAFSPNENNDRNHVVDNEISDWGDGVAVAGTLNDCTEPGMQHGTVIDNNDIYVTSAKYVDCTTGAADPNGQCACAENAIDLKADGGPVIADWTIVTNNRVWGMRPTTDALVCGGSGALGQAISAGNECPGHVLAARNVVSDSTIGIEAAGSTWIIAGNLVHDIKASDGNGGAWGTLGILTHDYASNLDIEWNTIVNAVNSYDDRSTYTSTSCNDVLLTPEAIGYGHPTGLQTWTTYNYVYQSGFFNFPGPTNVFWALAAASRNSTLCYQRRQWTGEETVCVPYAATTSASPHRAAAGNCNQRIAEPFGIPFVGYWQNSPTGTCGLGAELAGVVPLLRRARRRRDAARGPS